MDWGKSHTVARKIGPPEATRIATLFRVVGASARHVRCATYRVATGIELRLEHEDREDILQTQLFHPADEEGIVTLAASWRATFDGRGFRDLAIL